jgi:DNA-binding transcriptional LysR family regulator
MDELKNLSKEFLSITFDQLRTLLFVEQEGSPHKALGELGGREQSSVEKQVKRLNEIFQRLCDEPLVKKGLRGEDYIFTQTGKEVVALTEIFLHDLVGYLEDRRRAKAQRLVIATTTFTLPILAELWDDVSQNLKKLTQLHVRQIRTKEFLATLEDRSVDLIFGGDLAVADRLNVADDYVFAEWGREEFCFLTNLSTHQFPGESITFEQLRNYPLILPEAGIITEAIRTWYGTDYQQQLQLHTILDVYYARELLLRGMVEGFMVATTTVAEMVTPNKPTPDSQRTSPQGAELPKLRNIKLGDGFKHLEIINGLFRRKGEWDMYASQDEVHPLVLFWETFEQYAAANKRIKP